MSSYRNHEYAILPSGIICGGYVSPKAKLADCLLQPQILCRRPGSFSDIWVHLAPSFSTVFVRSSGEFGGDGVPVADAALADCTCQYAREGRRAFLKERNAKNESYIRWISASCRKMRSSSSVHHRRSCEVGIANQEKENRD